MNLNAKIGFVQPPNRRRLDCMLGIYIYSRIYVYRCIKKGSILNILIFNIINTIVVCKIE